MEKKAYRTPRSVLQSGKQPILLQHQVLQQQQQHLQSQHRMMVLNQLNMMI